ncbi:MAG TPA: ABC transporter permease [Acidobacteriaceae bacterium]|jgi:predicted permease|nr:ABC transporter permease [Acidobacteriaceae bacterium]
MSGRMHEVLLRAKGLFRRKRMDREMSEELAFHQEMLAAKLLREGTAPGEVNAAARRRFGSADRWQERLREVWQFRTVENFGRDLRFATRVLRKSPGFTVIALLTLALGVGANTTVFSLMNGLLLRPLAVPGSDRLALLEIGRSGPKPNYSFPEPLFRGLEHSEAFTQVFAFDHAQFQVQGREGNENVAGQLVSGEFFPALETAPLLGRTLTPEDDRKGGDPAGFAAVISEGFWKSWFNRAPDVVGRKLTIDKTVFTVVGVMPKRFIGADPLERPEIYLPLATEPILNGVRSMTLAGYHGWWLTVMGRLQPGVTVEQASAQVMASTSAVLHARVPDAAWINTQLKAHFRFGAERGSTGFTYARLQFRQPLVAVMIMCGGILLLACLNLTSLLMARGAARERELATRLAVGATRRRLVQQLLTESLLIAVSGTALGLGLAPLVSKSLAALLLSGAREAHLDTSLDIRVFVFAALAAVLSTAVIGLVPALQSASSNLSEQIKSGQHATQAHERKKLLPGILMSFEVALALVLVVGAGLLATSLVRLYDSGEGFDPRGVENIAFSMDDQGLSGDALMQFYENMGRSLRALPGVSGVSIERLVPLTGFEWDQGLATAGQPSRDIDLNSVAPDYFRTMRIPLLEGRDFTWNDTLASGRKIILNQSAAKLFFPAGDAVGSIVKQADAPTANSYQVVGVVGDAKYDDMHAAPPAQAYFALPQAEGHDPSYVAVVRMSGPAGPLAGAVRQLARRMAPGIPAPVVTSMMETVNDSLSAERMMALLSVFFAACALLVTGIGLYGTLAYATARRTSEIGIRMALGAQRAQVVRLICGQNALVAILGTATGLAAALLASRALASFLYGTSVRDPWVLGGSVLALALIASAASLLPAMRAARIDPMAAIRCE